MINNLPISFAQYEGGVVLQISTRELQESNKTTLLSTLENASMEVIDVLNADDHTYRNMDFFEKKSGLIVYIKLYPDQGPTFHPGFEINGLFTRIEECVKNTLGYSLSIDQRGLKELEGLSKGVQDFGEELTPPEYQTAPDLYQRLIQYPLTSAPLPEPLSAEPEAPISPRSPISKLPRPKTIAAIAFAITAVSIAIISALALAGYKQGVVNAFTKLPTPLLVAFIAIGSWSWMPVLLVIPIKKEK